MAWLRNKKTGGWFEVEDDKVKANDYMNKKIRGGKRTIKKGDGKTKDMREADKKYINDYNKAVKQYNDKLRSPKMKEASDEQWDKSFRKVYGELEKKSVAARQAKQKAYTYKLTDENRRKAVNRLGNVSTKLDRKMDEAKTSSELRKLGKKYAKNQRKLKAIGGKYIIK